MTDLRQAAQAVIDRWDSPLWKNGSTANAIADLRAALEQQQAEPVAIVDDEGVIIVCSYKYKPGDKLYTAPPQRKPLTDEEIKVIEDGIWKSEFFDATERQANREFTRAIEAAHGIKEGT